MERGVSGIQTVATVLRHIIGQAMSELENMAISTLCNAEKTLLMDTKTTVCSHNSTSLFHSRNS
jgi:hypothetical protein